MGPVRQNPIQRTVRTAHLLCAIYDCVQLSVHNTAQKSSDNLPSYLQTTIIAQMLSIGREGGNRLAVLAVSVLSTGRNLFGLVHTSLQLTY